MKLALIKKFNSAKIWSVMVFVYESGNKLKLAYWHCKKCYSECIFMFEIPGKVEGIWWTDEAYYLLKVFFIHFFFKLDHSQYSWEMGFFLYFHDISVLSELSETFRLTRGGRGNYEWNWDRRHIIYIPDNLLPFINFSLAFCWIDVQSYNGIWSNFWNTCRRLKPHVRADVFKEHRI